MKKSLKNSLKKFNDFFEQVPNAKTQSWSLLNDFYHLLLSYMDENNINQTQLANRLGVSRSSVSQLFNRQPNITLNKISEIGSTIGLRLKLTSEQVEKPRYRDKVTIIKLASSFYYSDDGGKNQHKKNKNLPTREYESDYKVHYQNS